MLQWEIVKSSSKLSNPSLLKGRGCDNEILESGIKALKNGFNWLSLYSSKACKGMAYLFNRKCCEIQRTATLYHNLTQVDSIFSSKVILCYQITARIT